MAFFISAFLGSSCGGGSGSGGGGGSATPTPTPTASPTPQPPGDGDTVIIGQPGMCTPGDVARVDFSATARARFSLVSSETSCTPAKDNRNEEYTLILYNTTADDMSFRIDSPAAEIPPSSALSRDGQNFASDKNPTPPEANNSLKFDGPSEMANLAKFLYDLKPPSKYDYGKANTNPFLVSRQNLSVGDEIEYRVRASRDDNQAFTTTSVILRAQGDHISLFLDRDIPMGGVNADSPTQAQLDDIVSIFDQNIYPLVTTILGQPSDVDNDDRIHVVITPVLNRDLKTKAYVDARNVLPYNAVSNAGSNEAEAIFIFAPDSLGNYDLYGNSYTASEYFTDKIVNGWIAFQLPKIISYNQHVLVSGGLPEKDWIEDGIGAVMADLTGFNIFRPAAYRYLMAPQLDSLKEADDLDGLYGQGAEYLFMSYYLQAQMGNTLVDANNNNIDDNIERLGDLMTSNLVGEENLEAGIDISFDADTETKFQAIFKNWTIAMVTSGTNRVDIQQAGQDAVNYYLTENDLVYGSQIVKPDASGSNRVGADGGALDSDGVENRVGIDLSQYSQEDNILFENPDEYVYAPGNALNGYVEPYTVMFVRVSGMFQSQQTIAIFSSSPSLKGFLVRRSNVDYPVTYSESIFGSINQMFEDLDTSGPNPYWSNEGIAKKIDIEAMISDAPVDETSPRFLSVIGSIDTPSQIEICPEDTDDCEFVDVPDTDKYIFTVPDLPGRTDEGQLGIVIRRRFDASSDQASLKPMLAIVSSKDVPYPYTPHPIRNAINDGAGGTDTRQQYRWLTSALICGEGETGFTNVATVLCEDVDGDEAYRIYVEDGGRVENTGNLELSDMSLWNGDISGGDCDVAPEFSGGYGAFNVYPTSSVEVSGSSLASYPWLSGSGHNFMTVSYNGRRYPDVLFDREFIKPVSKFPSIDPENMYDPRAINGLTNNCNTLTDGEADLEEDSPDDLLEAKELRQPGSLAEQILTEMSRHRFTYDGSAESTALASQYVDKDVLVIDGDSRDEDQNCSTNDIGHNLNSYTVRTGEGSIIWGEQSSLAPHILGNLNNSAIAASNQNIYDNGGETVLRLTPGKNYTLIVGGQDNTRGDYEIRIRKISTAPKNILVLRDTKGDAEDCSFEF